MSSGPINWLTLEERRQIKKLRTEGQSYAAIGKMLGRPKATISNEIRRNGGLLAYCPLSAQRTADLYSRKKYKRLISLTDSEKQQLIADAVVGNYKKAAMDLGIADSTCRRWAEALVGKRRNVKGTNGHNVFAWLYNEDLDILDKYMKDNKLRTQSEAIRDILRNHVD